MSLSSHRSKTVRGTARGYVLALLTFALLPVWLWADAPVWWATREVLNPAATADDYAAVNQGQVKNIAKQAYEEMKAKLGSAGATLDSIWANPAASTDDYQAINLGQLKNVAKPFYDQLILVGYTTQYPWASSSTSADDYALANIGQVKNLFSFDLSALAANLDSDADGLPDVWEMQYFGHLGVDPAANPSGDGMSNLYKAEMGLNPLINEFNNDKDEDGMSNGYEFSNGLNPKVADGTGDLDGDGVPNQEDARPNDPTVGRLTVTIAAPLDGAVFP